MTARGARKLACKQARTLRETRDVARQEAWTMGDRKTLCSWKRGKYEEKLDKLSALVRNPRYVCVRCGRAAADKDQLCKPARLENG